LRGKKKDLLPRKKFLITRRHNVLIKLFFIPQSFSNFEICICICVCMYVYIPTYVRTLPMTNDAKNRATKGFSVRKKKLFSWIISWIIYWISWIFKKKLYFLNSLSRISPFSKCRFLDVYPVRQFSPAFIVMPCLPYLCISTAARVARFFLVQHTKTRKNIHTK
jgi:hypothetical protein